MATTDRGVSPVVSIILVIAIVVILAATISVPFFDIVDDINEPAPNVVDTTGEFEAGSGFDQQFVRITHSAGESVAVKEMEIIVRASGPDVDTEARLVDLPGDGHGQTLADENIQGNIDLISQTTRGPDDQIIVVEDSNMWETGDTIQFRINSGSGGADFREGEDPQADKLEVIIVHTPSNAILSEHTFTP